MANRIITATVTGETIRLSNKTAGAAGSFNAVSLSLTFDSAWDGTTKKLYFFDSFYANPVYILLTVDYYNSETGVYTVPIPAEPLAYAGNMTITIKGVDFATDGTTAERIIMSASTTMKVLSAIAPASDVAPVEPTPTQAEQLQGEIDGVKGDLAGIPTAVTAASNSATAAATSATAAQTAQTAAETARDAASSSKTAAATSESNAASSAAAASTSAENASASATAASTSASNASSSANASSSSASASASSASAADEAKTAAASSASAAATSEANAASSAQAAANSAASLTVVNDLTTGGTTNALSAEQGKVLSTSISTLSGSIVHFNLEQSLTTEQRHQARKNIGAAAEVGNMDAYELQEAVRQGRAKEILSVGDFFTVGINGSDWLFQAAAFDYDVPVNPNFTHSLRLLMYPCFASVVYDAREAIYYATAELPAGTYWFVNNRTSKYYSFATTQAIPAGGQVVPMFGASPDYVITQVNTYASQVSTTALETATATISDTAPTTGVQLTPVNDDARSRWGSNNWMQSAMRKWLNSSAASGWWTPSNNYDRPQSSPADGFLNGIDEDLLACIGKVRLRTGLNPVDNEGTYGYSDNEELVFLPSRTEMGFGNASTDIYETPVAADGTAKTDTLPLFTDNASRIKYLGATAREWWLRSPYPNAWEAYSTYNVSIAGAVGGSRAYITSYAAVPACVIY